MLHICVDQFSEDRCDIFAEFTRPLLLLSIDVNLDFLSGVSRDDSD